MGYVMLVSNGLNYRWYVCVCLGEIFGAVAMCNINAIRLIKLRRRWGILQIAQLEHLCAVGYCGMLLFSV